MRNAQRSGGSTMVNLPAPTAIRLGLIGCGQWGANVAAAADRAEAVHLVLVADINTDVAEALAGSLASAPRVAAPAALLADDAVDAVLVVTDAATHFELALEAMNNGKHVFVEKPLAMSSAECTSLLNAAESAGRTLMVGHTFLYSEYVSGVEGALTQGSLGDLRYVHLQRLAYGRFRDDANVTWNLGPHDVSILMHWAARPPAAVRCVEYMFTRPDIADLAFMTLDFGGFLGHIQLSCVDPEKVRRATIAGTAAGIVYDDVAGEVRLTANGTTIPIVLPTESDRRPLDVEIGHFAHCINTGERPKTDGVHGAMVVAVLEAAAVSAASGGTWVEVAPSISELGLGVPRQRNLDQSAKSIALTGRL